MTIFNSMGGAQQQLVGTIAIAGLLFTQILGSPNAAYATNPGKTPILLAQEQHVRIATLQCGGYTITIRTEGSAASDSYSYHTEGLFLRNGIREDETYLFYNNDYEYKVETRSGGTGRLTVSHYGERIMTKQCTWS